MNTDCPCTIAVVFLPPFVREVLFEDIVGVPRPTCFDPLTDREFQVFRLLAQGQCVKEIANVFELSFHTVKAHKWSLMHKLDIHNKAQLVRYAAEHKIIRPPTPTV